MILRTVKRGVMQHFMLRGQNKAASNCPFTIVSNEIKLPDFPEVIGNLYCFLHGEARLEWIRFNAPYSCKIAKLTVAV